MKFKVRLNYAYVTIEAENEKAVMGVLDSEFDDYDVLEIKPVED